jgi:hypothetical protein
MIDELSNHPSNNSGPMPNSPVLPSNGPPPKPLTPWISGRKKSGSNKRVVSKSNLLHRRTNHPRPRPRNPPNHIGPIEPKPITSIPIPSMKPPPKRRNPPNQLGQDRNLKPSDVPGMQELPKNVPPPPTPHPVPNMIEIRPRDGGKGGKELRPRGNSRPPLNRPPVMSNKMYGPATPNPFNNSDKITNEGVHPIPIHPRRRPGLPSPPHVIPNNPKPLPKKRDNPIPNGGIVRIPMHKHNDRPINRPVDIHGQPHPTSHNPPSTHKTHGSRHPQNRMR